MFRITSFWTFCCLQFSIAFADDIDSDYFFGSSYEALRARDALDCKNPVNVLFCKFKCKNDVGVCFENKCYCVYEPKPDLPKKPAIITDLDYPEQEVILKYNPGRRHHIAHFCPNLDVARKCIQKCMKEGKPAFCGKDHICYCGHRYSKHQKKDELDPAKINAGFYDLYLKYFGPDTTIMKEPEPDEHDEKSPNKNTEDPNESSEEKKEEDTKKSTKEEDTNEDNEEGTDDQQEENVKDDDDETENADKADNSKEDNTDDDNTQDTNNEGEGTADVNAEEGADETVATDNEGEGAAEEANGENEESERRYL